jgi:hypothetical protein
MKLGYRDRVVLIIAIIVVILGIGIFVFIKPKWESLNENKERLEQVQTDWDAKLIEFDRIPKKQDTINKRYEESLQISEEFTDEMDAIGLDKFMQENFTNNDQFKNDEVTVKMSMSVADEAAQTIGYYYYVPNIVVYPLFENADLDGSLAQETAQKLLESNVLSARTAQSIGTGVQSYTIQINKEDTKALLDSVKAYAEAHKDAMMLTGVNIKGGHFNEYGNTEENQAEPQLDADGNPVPTVQVNTQNTAEEYRPGYTEVTFIFKALYMQEPTKPDVGPKYDKTIWDGEEWRTAVAE